MMSICDIIEGWNLNLYVKNDDMMIIVEIKIYPPKDFDRIEYSYDMINVRTSVQIPVVELVVVVTC